MAIALVSWPVWTLEPPVTFDVDWVAALAYAAEHRLHFGDQIAFTYGPLGFLATPVGPLFFYDGVTTLQWLFSAIVQLLLAGALLIALRRSMPLVLAAIAAAVVLALAPDRTIALGFVLCTLRLTRDAHVPRDRLAAATPIVLGVVSGVLLLGKLNQGIELLVLATIALAAVPRRRDWLAFAAATLATAIVGWLASGQAPGDLWAYVDHGAEVIAGYAGAMGLADSSYGWTYPAALLITAAALGIAWDGSRGWAPRLRWSLLALLLVYAAFGFKEGFVRQDDVHLSWYFGDMLVLFAVLPTPRARGAAVVVALAATVVAFGVVSGMGELRRGLNPYENAKAAVGQVRTLASPTRQAAIEDAVRGGVAEAYGLSPQLLEAVGRRSVLLWPLLLTEVAYAYDLDLRPFPTLEPYATYTPALDRLGTRMLTAEHAPARILRVASPEAPIDGHHPTFEAPLATLAILCRYRDVAEELPWQVLARGPDRCGSSRTLGTVAAPWGEPIAVPPPRRPSALVLVHVDGAGEQGLERLRALVLRPHERWIALDGRRYRLVPATAADGLLLTAPPQADYPGPLAMARIRAASPSAARAASRTASSATRSWKWRSSPSDSLEPAASRTRYSSTALADGCRGADPLGMVARKTGFRRSASRVLRLALGTSWIAGRVGDAARGRDARPRYGRFFERHQRLSCTLALAALSWGAVYLTWRIGWTGAGASPVTFTMLLVTELYGIWALATLTWFSWKRVPVTRPPIVSDPTVDVYVCTYDEPEEVVLATLAGCRALRYPHTTYLLDDGRRENMRELAELTGAVYMTRPDNSHAKAGNINAALPRTEGDLVLMLDADHVPMPDALEALVGYFEDPNVGLVQSPHDFSNQDSVQHYAVGRHEQSLFYHVICPGKDRHGAAFWCGSAAVIRREALLGIGGVATETIAEDFHTTIRMQRNGWTSRYHDEVLVQGLAPHDLDGYLLQRDRWSRGNLAVFTLPESPLRASELRPLQRLSYFASLAAYLAPPMRLLLLVTLALVLWAGWLPMRVDWLSLAILWFPAVALNLAAGSALARGYMRVAETTHYELMTMGIYARALRCAIVPAKTAFKVTPKEGIDLGGTHALARLKIACALAVVLAAGIVMRVLDLFGIGPLPDLPPIAEAIIPLLALVELRRILRTLALVSGRRQRRLIYRFEGDAPALCLSPSGSIPGRLLDANATGLGLIVTAPLDLGAHVPIRLQLEDSEGMPRDVHVVTEVRSCRPSEGGYVLGARIVELEPAARVALMEWCYVVCSHQEVRGTRPGDRSVSAPAALPVAPRLVPQPAASIEPPPADVAAA